MEALDMVWLLGVLGGLFRALEVLCEALQKIMGGMNGGTSKNNPKAKCNVVGP